MNVYGHDSIGAFKVPVAVQRDTCCYKLCMCICFFFNTRGTEQKGAWRLYVKMCMCTLTHTFLCSVAKSLTLLIVVCCLREGTTHADVQVCFMFNNNMCCVTVCPHQTVCLLLSSPGLKCTCNLRFCLLSQELGEEVLSKTF